MYMAMPPVRVCASRPEESSLLEMGPTLLLEDAAPLVAHRGGLGRSSNVWAHRRQAECWIGVHHRRSHRESRRLASKRVHASHAGKKVSARLAHNFMFLEIVGCRAGEVSERPSFPLRSISEKVGGTFERRAMQRARCESAGGTQGCSLLRRSLEERNYRGGAHIYCGRQMLAGVALERKTDIGEGAGDEEVAKTEHAGMGSFVIGDTGVRPAEACRECVVEDSDSVVGFCS